MKHWIFAAALSATFALSMSSFAGNSGDNSATGNGGSGGNGQTDSRDDTTGGDGKVTGNGSSNDKPDTGASDGGGRTGGDWIVNGTALTGMETKRPLGSSSFTIKSIELPAAE